MGNGTVYLDRIALALDNAGPLGAVAAVGTVLVVVGFAFKVSAVPFHFWAPDTYEAHRSRSRRSFRSCPRRRVSPDLFSS
jgi:NADH:ubiquinone oxidoreductase subunit 2 (subunit N)